VNFALSNQTLFATWRHLENCDTKAQHI